MAKDDDPGWGREAMERRAAEEDRVNRINRQLEQQAAAARAAHDEARRKSQEK